MAATCHVTTASRPSGEKSSFHIVTDVLLDSHLTSGKSLAADMGMLLLTSAVEQLVADSRATKAAGGPTAPPTGQPADASQMPLAKRTALIKLLQLHKATLEDWTPQMVVDQSPYRRNQQFRLPGASKLYKDADCQTVWHLDTALKVVKPDGTVTTPWYSNITKEQWLWHTVHGETQHAVS